MSLDFYLEHTGFRTLITSITHPHPQVRAISQSAYALITWIRFCSLSSAAEHAFSRLQSILSVQDPRGLLQPLQREAAAQLAGVQGYTEFCHHLSELMSFDFADTRLMEKSRDAANSLEAMPYYILMDYLQVSTAVDETPYEFEATCEIIQPSRPSPIPAVYTQMMETLKIIVDRNESKIYDLGPEVHHIDVIMDMVLFLLETGQECLEIDLAEAVIFYVGARAKPGAGFNRALGRCSRLCSMLTNYLVGGSGRYTYLTIFSIWCLCLWGPPMASFNEETLTAVHAAPRLRISACAIAA
ncbi:hypothetical protein FB451DRAFT_1460526 [Mycena latifolia]|nr:hypothetical protein FB451DRAFT_1460526 [Mycena latifolia]